MQEIRWRLGLRPRPRWGSLQRSPKPPSCWCVSPPLSEMKWRPWVRPTIEYASALWDPYLQKDKHRLDMVQRRSARYVTNRYGNSSSVSDMIKQLNWTSLEDRRKNARLTMLYKINNQEVNITASHKLIPPNRISKNMGLNSFQIPACKTTARKESFYPRTIRDWNALPSSVTSASSLESFKKLLTN